jgi:oligogalacturonide lyase
MAMRFLLLSLSIGLAAAQDPPNDPSKEWIDPDTGHRVIHLSDEPGSGSLYFHYNAYTQSGDKMVFTTRHGISVIDLRTRKIEPLVEGRVSKIIVGRKTRQVFYYRDETAFATNLDTHATREIVKNPRLRTGDGFAVNADETLLGGSYLEGDAPPPQRPPPGQRINLEARWALHLPMALYTINIQTGEVKEIHKSTEWLNHPQFSPTDPTLFMFCHEGPWHKVDRIWTIHSDGTGLTQIHKRTMDMEIAGHEFFGRDGKTIWYDLQTPKSKVFWLAGYNLATKETVRYKVERENWSVHFNVSPDGKLFAGDGGGPHSVAAPGNGQWIYLFRPVDGELQAERLVNLAKHDYTLEPNVTFTPDMKWIVFRSNMSGASHVYAVEVAKAEPLEIPLWPNGAPGSEGKTAKEVITERGKDGVHNRTVASIHNPSLTVFPPEMGKANGAAVVICPGGGHRYLSIDNEGYDVARWLNSIGVAAFVLKYRLAREEGSTYQIETHALADGQQAMRVVRSRAAEWGVDAKRVGIIGFSAGGEVAALTGTRFDAESRPDLMILVYPGIRPETLNVTKDTPPAFFAHAADDTSVNPERSTAFFLALRQAGVPAELHIYARGGHGFGMRQRPLPTTNWIADCAAWLKDSRFLKVGQAVSPAH